LATFVCKLRNTGAPSTGIEDESSLVGVGPPLVGPVSADSVDPSLPAVIVAVMAPDTEVTVDMVAIVPVD